MLLVRRRVKKAVSCRRQRVPSVEGWSFHRLAFTCCRLNHRSDQLSHCSVQPTQSIWWKINQTRHGFTMKTATVDEQLVFASGEVIPIRWLAVCFSSFRTPCWHQANSKFQFDQCKGYHNDYLIVNLFMHRVHSACYFGRNAKINLLVRIWPRFWLFSCQENLSLIFAVNYGKIRK